MALLDHILSPELQLALADGVATVEAAKAANVEATAPAPEQDRYFSQPIVGGSGGFAGLSNQTVGLVIIGVAVAGLVLLVKS